MLYFGKFRVESWRRIQI